MYIANIRVTHATAPHEILDRLALTESKKRELYAAILQGDQVSEAIVIQTCNRFEVYISGKSEAEGVAQARKVLLDTFGADVAKYMIASSYLEALEHLLNVTSSVDSMIVGENQVLAQVKEALEFASTGQYSGRVLEPVFQKAISVGKRVRTETQISSGKVSIASAAVDLAKQHIPLEGKKVIIIGTGNMATLLAEYLCKFDLGELVVIGRTPERLTNFCERFPGRPSDFKSLPSVVADGDVLFSATSCPHVLVTRGTVEAAMKGRETPLTLIDIATPSDIDPTAGELEHVNYYSIDDLKEISCRNMAARQDEVKKANAIIQSELERFKVKLESLHIERFLTHLNVYIEDIRRRELEKALNMIDSPDPKVQEVMEGLSVSLTKKVMHNFLTGIRSDPAAAGEMERFIGIFLGNDNVSEGKDEKA